MQTQPTLFDAIWTHKVKFLLTFFVIFTVSYGVLFALDWLPEAPSAETEEPSAVETTEATKEVETPTHSIVPVADAKEIEAAEEVVVGELPVALAIPELDREVKVLNPSSTDIATLDAALLKGLVRHPASAKLGEAGNVLILGHSSYLPNVMNKNFQALNGIQKLKWGDVIEVESGDKVYTYRVEKVYQAKASGITIPTQVEGKRLTLVTCNSFGSKEDRFIVEAKLISEKAL